MIKTTLFRTGLSNTSLDPHISKIPCTIESLGFDSDCFDGKNIHFADEVPVGWGPGDISRGVKSRGFVRPLLNPITIGVVPYDDWTESHENFLKQVVNFARKGAPDVQVKIMDSYSEQKLNEISLSHAYSEASNGIDILLVELQDKTESPWACWKKASNRLDVRTQMFQTRLIGDQYAPMNVALGIIGKLGGVPFNIVDSRTKVEAWLGIDVGYRDGTHFGANCIAFESLGDLIGWSDVTPLRSERLPAELMARVLKNSLEEVNAIRLNEGLNPVRSIGLLRDGPFNELVQTIVDIEKEYDVSINVFEVRKSGGPRMANRNGTTYSACSAGTAFWTNEWGFLQPSNERPRMGSPIVIQIHRIHSDLDMSDVVHDIFWLSKLHPGATMQPGLPVPIHFADRISKHAGLGIMRNPGFSTNLDFL